MNRFILLSLVLASCGGVNSRGAAVAAASKASRPNILWLFAEDFGQHLGCYGAKEVWMPNLDARRGNV